MSLLAELSHMGETFLSLLRCIFFLVGPPPLILRAYTFNSSTWVAEAG